MVAFKQPQTLEPTYLTPHEYLERERTADTKSEYDCGVVTAMAGASWEHNLITGNILTELRMQLRGKPCLAVANDQRVRVSECDKYYYPDIVLVCGNPQFEDGELDTLLNPMLIVEVLSDSTAAKDRGEKLECYRMVPTLNIYMMVAQDRPFIELYSRQANGWLYATMKEMEGIVALNAIGSELRLADIYAQVAFNTKRS